MTSDIETYSATNLYLIGYVLESKGPWTRNGHVFTAARSFARKLPVGRALNTTLILAYCRKKVFALGQLQTDHGHTTNIHGQSQIRVKKR